MGMPGEWLVATDLSNVLKKAATARRPKRTALLCEINPSRILYQTLNPLWLRFTQASTYKFILIKPTDHLQHAFNLERELVCVFSPYDDFHPRILDAISKAQSLYPHLRVDRICGLVVSKDEAAEQKLRRLLQNDTEAQIVIPFTYSELRRPNSDTFFFRNRLRAHFYTRDLFASESPLKTDLFFFGRTDLVHQLVDRHRTDQVSALFGLRKAGKTSVIYGVHRALKALMCDSVSNRIIHRNGPPTSLKSTFSSCTKRLVENQSC